MFSFLCIGPPARLTRLGACALACLVFVTGAMAQLQHDPVRALPLDVPSEAVAVQVDSGALSNPSDRQEPIYETVVGDKDATWLRLFFAPRTRVQPGTQLRITSLLDGAVQLLDAETIVQWNYSTAYFNGDQVKIEVLAPAGSSGNRIVVDLLHAGLPGQNDAESICGTDDRVLSNDPRAARLISAGCTGWLINECFLTAGHCLGNTVAQFNVPLSSPSGSLNHPPPSDQYTIDSSSKQGVGGGVGNDWGYFGVFDNSTTGLSALEAQGAKYSLATNMPAVSGQDIRITGYGVDSTPPDYTQVQQTNAGPFRVLSGTTVRYETDTTGGNSGSAVHDLDLDQAIGIHTHAGCTSTPGTSNQGTAISHAALQNALRNPTGVCVNQPACTVNGVCDPGEDCFNCPADCGHAPPGGGGGFPVCGNNLCEVAEGEDCFNCPADCNRKSTGNPSTRYCCGGDVGCEEPGCTGGGNICTTDPPATEGYCCGDATCEGNEDAANCAVDCSVTCSVPADCDDLNECTTDDCVGGTCQNTAVADDTSCSAGAGICCSGSCTTATCDFDADCDDSDVCTDDFCLNPGTCNATCDNPSNGGPGCDCTPTHNKEKGPRCSDGIDNDCDGLIDGADPDC